MMVQRKDTGWEGLRDSPEMFFEKVLNLQPTPDQGRLLAAIAAGNVPRLGLVCDIHGMQPLDEARFAVAVSLWRAATMHRPTMIWTGRRRVAGAWISLAIDVLEKATSEFRTDFLVRRPEDRALPWGVVMPTGCWALRYAGPFLDDNLLTADALGNRADILFGDFEWTDSDSVGAALEYADHFDALVTLVVPAGGARW
jgi:hypothetical protein